MKKRIARFLLGMTALVICSVWSNSSYTAAADGSSKTEIIRGRLEVIAECEETGGETLYFVDTGSEKLQVKFDSKPKEDLQTGIEVTMSGVRTAGKFAADPSTLSKVSGNSLLKSSSSESSSAMLTNGTGEKRVLVILVNFQDKQTQPFTPQQAADVTFNTTSNYFREASYGQTWLTGDVFGWFTIPLSYTVCDKNALAAQAQQAAVNAGADLSSYTNIVYGFPSNACSFSGSSTIGGNPSQSWINHFFNINSVGHELGHGLGLYHSRSLDCGTDTVGETCTTGEYGDVFDIMGGGASAHMNLYQKERLGWVNQGTSPPVQTVTASGTYWIDAYETPAPSSKGLKILKSTDPATGQRTWYYLEHRTPTGFDSYLASPNYNVINGVSFHTGSEGSGAQNYLLDMTPTTTSWYDPALVTGLSFTDPVAGVTITVLSADNTGASVQVQMNAQPCVRANPTVSVSPGQSYWVSSGTVYEYAVTVRSNNSGGCGTESYSMSATPPTAWGANYSAASLALSNGGSAASTLSVVSPMGTTDGVYNFNVSAVNSASQSFAGSASASYVVVSRLGVTASPGNARYSRTQTASVTANVSAAGSPQAGASVTFTMTKPGGAVVTQTVTSAANGNAVFTYRFERKRDPTGTYTVNVVAGFNGYSGQAATSFLVNR